MYVLKDARWPVAVRDSAYARAHAFTASVCPRSRQDLACSGLAHDERALSTTHKLYNLKAIAFLQRGLRKSVPGNDLPVALYNHSAGFIRPL